MPNFYKILKDKIPMMIAKKGEMDVENQRQTAYLKNQLGSFHIGEYGNANTLCAMRNTTCPQKFISLMKFF